jgi:superfamily II DNA or RNA helicase
VDRIAHGEKLLELITKAAPEKVVYFISGEVDGGIRDDIKATMENSDNVVCIAIARIFSTGVNVKNIHYILFANEWKARISIIQTIGRGVRKMDGKSEVVIFDLFDQTMYGMKHFEERTIIYDTENFKYKQIEFIEQ